MADQNDKPIYDQQYCEKHDQKYGDHLHACPICVGEKYGEMKIAEQPNIMEATKSMEDKGV